MKIDLHFNKYNQYLIDNNYSVSAITAYYTGLKLFSKYLDKNNVSIEDLTISNINNYIDSLKDKLSPSTQKVYLNGVKNYLDFIVKYYNFKLEFDFREIRQIRQIKKVNKLVNIEEINKILKSIKINNSIKSKRDYLIINLIIKTGIRISELVKIKNDNIFENKIFIKNNEYFIDKKMSDIIKDFKKEKEIKNDSDYLFTPFSKNITNNNNITSRSIQDIIKKYFNNYSFNDLRLVYYKSLIDELPDITQIHKHKTNVELISLREINNII